MRPTGRYLRQRRAGVFLAVSSLPSPYGIGDFGPAAFEFIDWLVKAKQSYWQILPLSIPDSTGSPYASGSRLAGNWLLISPALLKSDGYWPPRQPIPTTENSQAVSYHQVFKSKWSILRTSYAYFKIHQTASRSADLEKFIRRNDWVKNYALYQALKEKFHQQPWWTWPEKYRDIKQANRTIDRSLERRMMFHMYIQWVWQQQWQRLHQYANRSNIAIIGDLPFYVKEDSVDVWQRPELFILNRRHRAQQVAGVPPDAFSKKGQRWGNPLYRWPAHQAEHFLWWTERLKLASQRYDIIRFDHWRGLVRAWQVSARAKGAIRGRWIKAPGAALLRTVKRRLPKLSIIVEDLGAAGPSGDGLRKKYRWPTIRVFVFGWGGLPDNAHRLRHISKDVVYYTSNHDTNTLRGWWEKEGYAYEKAQLKKYLTQPALHWSCIKLVYRTPANTVIVPLVDMLNLGSGARLNKPGTKRNNWAWRISGHRWSTKLAKQIGSLVTASDRLPKP